MVKFDAQFRSTSDRFSAGFRNTDERFAADFGAIQTGGGGSEVIVDPVLTEGTKIATITVDDEPTDLYAPTPEEAPVTSVNGKTGDVELDADDVGALPDSTYIPTKTSDLQNDSGFITQAAVPTNVSDLTNDSGFLTLADLPIYQGGVS